MLQLLKNVETPVKKPDLNIVSQSTPSEKNDASVSEKIDRLTIDGELPDDEGPKNPPSGGGAARPVPQPFEDQWVKSLAAFEAASVDLSRAARNVQIIRHPLESLARDILTMTREIGGMREELSLLRQNLVPPIAIESMSTRPLLVKHDGPLAACIKPPSMSRRAKWIAWHVARAVIGALAAWGALQAIGWFWPELLSFSNWLK